MKKKEYQKPTMELIEADLGQQILYVSVTSVKSVNAKGLDDEDFEYSDEKRNSWDNAW